MPEREPKPVQRRIDPAGADMASMVALDLAEPQPQPEYENLFVEPDIPPADEPA